VFIALVVLCHRFFPPNVDLHFAKTLVDESIIDSMLELIGRGRGSTSLGVSTQVSTLEAKSFNPLSFLLRELKEYG
jgi:hypothetical protein